MHIHTMYVSYYCCFQAFWYIAPMAIFQPTRMCKARHEFHILGHMCLAYELNI